MRLLGTAAIALVGVAGVSHSLALSLRSGNPEQAYALAPWDGRVAGAWSEKLAGPAATPADRVKADVVARTALRHDPTVVDAVATLGLDALTRGNVPAARRLFAYSERLSRRDLRTHLWAVEDAVARGDVGGALTHYDLALRTSRLAPDLLFPILAGAIAEPAVRVGLVRIMGARPIWGSSFTDYIASNGPDPQVTAALFRDLGRVGVPVSGDDHAAVIAGLVGRDLVDEAWGYYAALHPGADRRTSRDPRFDAAKGIPSPLNWVPIDDPAMAATIQRGTRGGLFDFSAPASVGGPVLTQLQLLPPGDYLLSGHSVGIDQPEGSRPYWLLSCRNDKRELGRVPLPNSAQADGAFAGRLGVPANCPMQVLTLVLRPSDMVSGISGQLDRVELRPSR